MLEGRFEQLNDIEIHGFRMDRNALDAVLRHPPNLMHLRLESNKIGNEGCGELALGLKEGCPHLQTLNLKYSSIDSLSDALGQLRSLTCLEISFNRIRRIQPALYALILQLDTFDVFLCPLEDPP